MPPSRRSRFLTFFTFHLYGNTSDMTYVVNIQFRIFLPSTNIGTNFVASVIEVMRTNLGDNVSKTDPESLYVDKILFLPV